MTITQYKRALREHGCVVTGYRGPVELHHTHGGSMLELGGVLRGVSQKSSDWLQIPLARWLHTGDLGIDRIGVEEWELRFGRQIDHLETICRRLEVNVFELAGYVWEVTK